jgi:hypothetical protein
MYVEEEFGNQAGRREILAFGIYRRHWFARSMMGLLTTHETRMA